MKNEFHTDTKEAKKRLSNKTLAYGLIQNLCACFDPASLLPVDQFH